MRICLICNQIAAWGKIGGFGTAARAIGAGLVRRGVEVHAVIPRRARQGQQSVERLDGIIVHAPTPRDTMFSGDIFREIQADIYHSQEPTIASWHAQRAMPGARHIVTCRDPRSLVDHFIELRHTNLERRLLWPVTWLYEVSPWVYGAVRGADAVFCPARCLTEKIRRLYGASVSPHFVPSPVNVPDRPPVKAAEPTVIFVGRWDRRKRIERFFELAGEFPGVRFLAIGKAHDERYDRHLRQRYGGRPNLEMPGFVSRFDAGGLDRLYEQAWILVNTSAREALPYTFVEAAAWGCAILCNENPDEFATRFGCWVRDNDFARGLHWLLEDDRWRTKGELAAREVAQTFREEASLDQHLNWYERLLSEPIPRSMRRRAA